MLEIFQFDFLIRAFIAGTMIALIAPAVGIFLVVRRLSLMADTLAHVALAGVAIGILLGINPVAGAIAIAVGASLLIERLRSTKKSIYGESILALFLSGSLAIAAVLLSIGKGFNLDLFSFLFGSIATVSYTDVWLITGLGVLVLTSIAVFYKELFLVSFDDELAQVSGVNASLFNFLLVVLAAITVALAMRIVGILLVGALMVIPAITAMQWGRSFFHTLVFSLVFSVVAVVTGFVLSYYLDLASGGTIVVVSLLMFIATLMSAP